MIRGFGSRAAAERAAEAAFWLVLLLAFLLGGARAGEGFVPLMQAVLPIGFSQAQAGVQTQDAAVRLALRLPDVPSRFAPEVLTPVPSHEFPAWLSARLRSAGSAEAPLAAAARPLPSIAPEIAIVIDDLGNDGPQTEAAIALPASVTLAFLPYPAAASSFARTALRAGHQVMLHMPMEPVGTDDPGPMALRTDLSAAENLRRLEWALAQVPGASGLNNHMGSRFTTNSQSLVPVLEELAARHIFFLDSRTTAATVAVPLAHAFAVTSAGRDVFLDDVETHGSIEKQLAETERLARKNGEAIAIGHPHAVTLAVLKTWCAQAQAHGYRLVPASVAIRRKTERAAERFAMAHR